MHTDLVSDLLYTVKTLRAQRSARETSTLVAPRSGDYRTLDDALRHASSHLRSRIDALLRGYEATFPHSPLFSEVTLLGPIGCGRAETAITRGLAWLFDPSAKHGFGDALIVAFMSGLTGVTPDRIQKPRTAQAECIVDGGRLDVLVEQPHGPEPWRLVIEAKVDAHEQLRQCTTYEQACAEFRGACHLVFLTCDGRMPESTDAPHAWKAIRYVTLCRWILPQLLQLHERPGFHFARLFVASLLADVSGWSLGDARALHRNNRIQLHQLLEAI